MSECDHKTQMTGNVNMYTGQHDPGPVKLGSDNQHSWCGVWVMSLKLGNLQGLNNTRDAQTSARATSCWSGPQEKDGCMPRHSHCEAMNATCCGGPFGS
eukprot:352020-Chlamydomonas_euryale.AAC.15